MLRIEGRSGAAKTGKGKLGRPGGAETFYGPLARAATAHGEAC